MGPATLENRDMAFNLGGLARFTYKQLFKSSGTDYRLSPKRISRLLTFYVVFFLVELATWTGFLIDNVFLEEYRQVDVKQPVFIVGNPRSGTSFILRLLGKDTKTFTCMDMWEVLLAPSVMQRQIVRWLGDLDKTIGRPLDKLALAWRRQWRENNVAHRMGLRVPEEDQYLLLHIWSTLAIWVFSGILDEARPYTYFDSLMPAADKRRIMSFYKRCVQRHLYAHAGREGGQHYLGKNPSASPKVDTLYEFFPDAKIIYVARNPLDTIPSYISLLDYEWRLFGDPIEPFGGRDYVLEMARHWYTYPLERLEQAPPDQYTIVRFDDLVNDAEQTVMEIYDRFGLELPLNYARLLEDEGERARNFRSEHKYSLAEIGLERDQIVAEFADVFERFDFDPRRRADERGTMRRPLAAPKGKGRGEEQ